MNLLFRAGTCVVLLMAMFLANYQHCDAGKSRRKQGKHSRTSKALPKKPPMRMLLDLLDQQRGGARRPKHHKTMYALNLTNKLSAPRYMLNLYNNLKNHSVEDNSQGFNVTNITTTKPVKDADTIMGILNDIPDNEPTSSHFQMKFRFLFDARIEKNEGVAAAEFHVYKDSSQYLWMNNMSFVIQLDVITIPGTPAAKLRHELTKRVVHGWETRWLIFDVTSTFDLWIASPKNNYGLSLTVTTFSSQSQTPVDPAKFGFVGFKGQYEHRPFIVSFFKGDPTERSVILHASKRRRRSVFNPNDLKYGNKAGVKACRLRHLYVDFHELSWQSWIIAPDGYESSYCDGECTYPMLSPKNSTNHAIVQTLVHLLNPDAAPNACCAPTKLNAISVLYYDGNQNVILKKFKDMVVKSCGCH